MINDQNSLRTDGEDDFLLLHQLQALIELLLHLDLLQLADVLFETPLEGGGVQYFLLLRWLMSALLGTLPELMDCYQSVLLLDAQLVGLLVCLRGLLNRPFFVDVFVLGFAQAIVLFPSLQQVEEIDVGTGFLLGESPIHLSRVFCFHLLDRALVLRVVLAQVALDVVFHGGMLFLLELEVVSDPVKENVGNFVLIVSPGKSTYLLILQKLLHFLLQLILPKSLLRHSLFRGARVDLDEEVLALLDLIHRTRLFGVGVIPGEDILGILLLILLQNGLGADLALGGAILGFMDVGLMVEIGLVEEVG